MFRSGSTLSITRLSSGGLITNYRCPSRCGHCLYASSPHRAPGYIDRETAATNLALVRSLGCTSIHVGGGEPFLSITGLKNVLIAAADQGVGVEYVETNSSWYRDPESAGLLLKELKELGLTRLLVSISPFHNEHIPFKQVKGVLKACRRTGMGIFPWIEEFYSEMDALADDRTHKLAEYEQLYGGRYLNRIPGRYWVHFGGRAVYTFAPVLGTYPVEEILARNPGGCRELTEVGHFHVDLNGCYIPGLCSGLVIRVEDLGRPLLPENYPLLTTLFIEGVKGLYELAGRDFGFRPTAGYLNKCHLCLEIRRELVRHQDAAFTELGPLDFYDGLEIEMGA